MTSIFILVLTALKIKKFNSYFLTIDTQDTIHEIFEREN